MNIPVGYLGAALSDVQSTAPAAPAAKAEANVPLCVDLDGTVILTDLLWESLVGLLRRNPLYAMLVPFWLLHGRARLKREIAVRARINASTLPYNEVFLDRLRAEHRSGRPLYLVTASDRELAMRVADHLAIFREVLGSDGKINLRGSEKARQLASRFGERGFDYAGDSAADLSVWPHARRSIIVNANRSVAALASAQSPEAEPIGAKPSRWLSSIKSLRPHQWVKNLIVLVPSITSHQIVDAAPLKSSLMAFVAFCLCASGVYVLNDLIDLEADRHHQNKRFRPFASGRLPLVAGLVLAPILFVAAAALASSISIAFLAVLGLYLILATGYSWRVKQIALLDVFVLAGLYVIRLIAGHSATGIPYSVWLLAFSMFIFLSLALLKRFIELLAARQENKADLKGRGYVAGDLELVTMLGTSSGFLSVLVLALYVNSDEVRILYQHPALLLLICPLFLYWISRVWLLGHRGQMHDDPVVFALKDPISYLLGFSTLVVLWLAS